MVVFVVCDTRMRSRVPCTRLFKCRRKFVNKRAAVLKWMQKDAKTFSFKLILRKNAMDLFLKQLVINPQSNAETIIVNVHKLAHFLSKPNHNTISSSDCKNLLFAALALHTFMKILKCRTYTCACVVQQILQLCHEEYSPAALDDPIHYVCIRIVESVQGEQHIPAVADFLKRLHPDDNNSIGDFLQKLQTYFRRKFQTEKLLNTLEVSSAGESGCEIEVLELIGALQRQDRQRLPQIIRNVVYFTDTNFRIEHFMKILLIKRTEYGYTLSCQIYKYFVDSLKSNEYVAIFWPKLCQILEHAQLIKVFFDCCQLIGFFDGLCAVIGDHLMQFKSVYNEHTDEHEWQSTRQIAATRIEFHEMAKIVSLLMCEHSPVCMKFVETIRSRGISDLFWMDICRQCFIYRHSLDFV